MQLDSQFDLNGNRTRLSATITTPGNVSGTPDFLNNYSYDRLNRPTWITQQGQSGGNFVGIKAVEFAYDNAGRLQTQYDANGYQGTAYGDANHGDTLVAGNLTPSCRGIMSMIIRAA